MAKRILTKQLDLIPTKASLDELREAAKSCKNCDLWKLGTQTVFGEGAAHNKLMLVGEQPGDQEDQAGKPFVGPAGKLLDSALVEAGIDRKTFSANQSLVDAAAQDGIKQSSQQIALSEATVAVLREGRMVGDVAIKPKAAKPAIRQVQVDLFAQAPLGSNAKAVSNQQHPDHQFGGDRGTPDHAVEPR